jgi:molybdopterin biosynthesis enzyme
MVAIIIVHLTVLFFFFFFITEALNRVLAEDIYAAEPHPPFPASVKDGYAIIGAFALMAFFIN